MEIEKAADLNVYVALFYNGFNVSNAILKMEGELKTSCTDHNTVPPVPAEACFCSA